MVGNWRVYIDGLEVYGFHGVSPEEQSLGHRLRLRAEAEIRPPKNPVSDDLNQTLDYGMLCDYLVSSCTSQTFKTLEALAWAMATELLKKFRQVQAISLTIEKVNPPVPHVLEAAGVELVLTREDLA